MENGELEGRRMFIQDSTFNIQHKKYIIQNKEFSIKRRLLVTDVQ